MSMTTGKATRGTVDRWRMGDEGDWCTIYVDLGPLHGEVAMSSRTARSFALDVLAEQGPYLGYQPPNEHMREQQAPGFSTPVAKPSRRTPNRPRTRTTTTSTWPAGSSSPSFRTCRMRSRPRELGQVRRDLRDGLHSKMPALVRLRRGDHRPADVPPVSRKHSGLLGLTLSTLLTEATRSDEPEPQED